MDKRTDIWAFGVVLYEMLASKQLFHGETVSDILAAVLKEEPNLDQSPQKVHRLLRRRLDKDPKNRLRDIGDWALLLEDPPMEASRSPRPVPGIAVVGGVCMVAALIVSGVLLYRATRPADGAIIAALQNTGVLYRVASNGGTPVPVTKLNAGERTQRWPEVLPGSHAALFVSSSTTQSYDAAAIEVVSLKTGERKTLERGGTSPHFLTTSDGAALLVFLRSNTLFAAPFDPGRLTLTGPPSPLLAGIGSNERAGPRRILRLPHGGHQSGWSIFWLDNAGKTQPLHERRGIFSTPRFSPDGKRLAFLANNGQGEDIWVEDLDRDTASRLTFFAGNNGVPVWTPDGKNIVFASTNPAAPGLYWIHADGSGEAQRLTDGTLQERPYSFSPNGKRLAFSQRGNGESYDIFTAPVEGDAAQPRLGKAELFLGTPFNEGSPAFSPDGSWMAYSSLESGTNEVYVRFRQLDLQGTTFRTCRIWVSRLCPVKSRTRKLSRSSSRLVAKRLPTLARLDCQRDSGVINLHTGNYPKDGFAGTSHRSLVYHRQFRNDIHDAAPP